MVRAEIHRPGVEGDGLSWKLLHALPVGATTTAAARASTSRAPIGEHAMLLEVGTGGLQSEGRPEPVAWLGVVMWGHPGAGRLALGCDVGAGASWWVLPVTYNATNGS